MVTMVGQLQHFMTWIFSDKLTYIFFILFVGGGGCDVFCHTLRLVGS